MNHELPKQKSRTNSGRATVSSVAVALKTACWFGAALSLGFYLAGISPFWITAALCVGIPVLIGIDASRLRMGRVCNPVTGKIQDGPGMWVALSLLVWVIAYPLYIWRRGQYVGERYGWFVPLLGMLLSVTTSYGIYVHARRAARPRIAQAQPRFQLVQKVALLKLLYRLRKPWTAPSAEPSREAPQPSSTSWRSAPSVRGITGPHGDSETSRL